MIEFESPKNQSSIIKIIGVGGGGGNAVDYMFGLGIEGVDFIVCNTDSQALERSPVPNKIQLGPNSTQGLGAGANPEIGKQAGEESADEIADMLQVKTRMAFITAGMGGGTGTGAAPIIAKVCQEHDILTVGIVTTPFAYEGPKRMRQAQEGISTLKEYVDTILIISNDKLRQQFGNLPFSQAFGKADNILATAAKCITDLITVDGRVNLDFNDVQTVMKKGGVAILGSAVAEGEDRAHTAVVEALNSPLLNDDDIEGAKWILLNITSAPGEFEHTLDELETIQGYVQEKAGNSCDIILGMGSNESLGNKIAVTIIATGFKQNEIQVPTYVKPAEEPKKVVLNIGQKDVGEMITKNSETPKKKDQMTPTLVNPQTLNEEMNPIVSESEQTWSEDVDNALRLELPDNKSQEKETLSETQPVTFESNETDRKELGSIKLVIKEEKEIPSATIAERPAQNDSPYHSIDQEQQRSFEEEQRIFEQRVEKLRQMSFNYQAKESEDELENVPAYKRQHINLEDRKSKDELLSNYFVEDSEQNGKKQGEIRTINTFLQGKKPD